MVYIVLSLLICYGILRVINPFCYSSYRETFEFWKSPVVHCFLLSSFKVLNIWSSYVGTLSHYLSAALKKSLYHLMKLCSAEKFKMVYYSNSNMARRFMEVLISHQSNGYKFFKGETLRLVDFDTLYLFWQLGILPLRKY